MEIVSSDDADADDDDKSFFDRVMVLCHDSFSDSSSDGEDKEEALFVWGGIYTREMSSFYYLHYGTRTLTKIYRKFDIVIYTVKRCPHFRKV
jgi:hypothetical protein